MSYFVIIRGPLGVGKTTISKALAQKLGAELIAMDEVLEKNHLAQVPPGVPCIPEENFIKANEIILPHVMATLEGGRIVVFDACFYYEAVIEHLLHILPFSHYVFTLKAPLELCITRDSQRNKAYGEGATIAVHSPVSRFDYGFVVDVTGTLEDALKIIFSYLPKSAK